MEHGAGDFEAAFDLMLFQLGRSVFTHGYRGHALDITVRETVDRPIGRMNDAEFANWSPAPCVLAPIVIETKIENAIRGMP